MTTVDGKYPNKKDLAPKVEIEKEKVVIPDELPLADPADSDSGAAFAETAQQDGDAKHKPSAYSQNKSPSQNHHELKKGEESPSDDQEENNRKYNSEAHGQWNEHKNIEKPTDLS